MAHICTRHGTHRHESWHKCEYGTAHIGMSHGTHKNESWHVYERIMTHTTAYGVPVDSCEHVGVLYRNESWCTYEYVMAHIEMIIAHIGMSHGTHLNESWHMYE